MIADSRALHMRVERWLYSYSGERVRIKKGHTTSEEYQLRKFLLIPYGQKNIIASKFDFNEIKDVYGRNVYCYIYCR